MKSLKDKLRKANGKVFSTEDLALILGHRVNIRKALDLDLVQKITRGFYGVNASIGSEHFAIIQKYYPEAVVCGNSALFYQDLSDYDPGPVDLAIPREGSKLSNSDYLTFHRISSTKTSFGIEKKNIQSFKLRIYTPERCLFEVAKHGPNSEEFKKCVVRYFKTYRLKRITKIIEMGHMMTGANLVLSALHALQESKNIY